MLERSFKISLAYITYGWQFWITAGVVKMFIMTTNVVLPELETEETNSIFNVIINVFYSTFSMRYICA